MFIIGFLLVNFVLAGEFPRIAFMDPLSVHRWEGGIDYQSAIDSAWYVPQMKRCGMTIIHTKAYNDTNSYPDYLIDYLVILEDNGMRLAQEDFHYANIKYIHGGYYECWPIGYDSKLRDYERHLSRNYYTIANSAYGSLGEEILPDSTIYYFYSLAGVHSAGKVLDGSAFKAGYWRYGGVPIRLLIKAKIDHISGLADTVPVVSFIVYEKDFKESNVIDELFSAHSPSYPDASGGDDLPSSYELTFTVGDFSTPGEWENILHSTVMNQLDEASLFSTCVDMIWHGNVDFYLDGFELRSQKNFDITYAPSASDHLNMIQSQIMNRSPYNGQSRGLVWNYYFDEPWYNQYQSYGILNAMIHNTYPSQSLTGATGGRLPSDLSKYRYLESTGNAFLMYNFYPFDGERTVSQALDALTERLNRLNAYSQPRKIPLMPVIQVHEGIQNGQIWNADVSPTEIWAQGWLSIAHGAQGLIYFLYSTFEHGSPDKWSYRGLVDINGDPAERDAQAGPYVPNEKYEAVKQMNQAIASIEDQLTDLNWEQTVRFTNGGVSSYPYSQSAPAYTISAIQNENGGDLDIEAAYLKDSEARTIMVLVNRNTLENKSLRVTLSPVNQPLQLEDLIAKRLGDRPSHQLISPASPQFQLFLEAGEGRVLRLSTGISGELTHNEYWQGEMSLKGTLTIPAGIALDIRGGTQIHAFSQGKIVNGGSLQLSGSAGSPVMIAGEQGARWAGIYSSGTFEAAYSQLNNAVIALNIGSGSFHTANCTFEHNDTGIKTSVSGRIENCLFTENSNGVYASGCGLFVENCQFSQNTVGLKGYNLRGTINESLFQQSGRTALWLSRSGMRITGNQFVNNECAISCQNGGLDRLSVYRDAQAAGIETNNLFAYNLLSAENSATSLLDLGTLDDGNPTTHANGGWNRFECSVDFDIINENRAPVYAQVNDWLTLPKVYGAAVVHPSWNENLQPIFSKSAGGDSAVDSVYFIALHLYQDSLYSELRTYTESILETNRDADFVWPLLLLNEQSLVNANDSSQFQGWLNGLLNQSENRYVQSVLHYFDFSIAMGQGDWSGFSGIEQSINLLSALNDSSLSEELAWHLFEAAYWAEKAGTMTKTASLRHNYYQTLEENYPHSAAFSFWNDLKSDSDATPAILQNYELLSCYPNPFNAGTMLHYELPEAANVEISIYNLQGKRLGALLRGRQNPGVHKLYWNTGNYASGIYFIRLETSYSHHTVKAMLMK